MRDSKSPQVSTTILSVLNNIVVWMVTTHLLISKSYSPFMNTLVTVSVALIAIDINVTFIFHSFFDSLAKSKYLSYFVLSFSHHHFHWSLSNSKSPQVSKTTPHILADLNNAIVGMFSICPFIFKSSNLCTNPLVTIKRPPVTICFITIFLKRVFHNNVSWCFLTGVWVTASFLKSSGLFSVFWAILINAVIWMISTWILIFKSSSFFFYQSFGDCSKCTNFNRYHCWLLVT